MRALYTLAAVAFIGGLVPSVSMGQATGLSITNLALVNETRVDRTTSDYEYRADIVNTGVARAAVTATLTSTVPSVVVRQGSLHFTNVPSNGRATSTDTFTIRVDRTVVFNIASLVWAFSAPGAPVANAGANQTLAVGATATLNGSGSTNPSGVGTLTYSWAFTSKPGTSAATITNPTSVNPTFVVDVAGSYVIRLTLSNGTATDTASVTISTSNTAPVANAGPNQSVAVGATVTLNGSGSSDVDGNALTFLWTLTGKPAGSTAALSSTTAVMPAFTADRAGTYTATLVVNDGTANSNTATVTISTTNTAPVANAGPDQAVNVGAVAQLTGAGSTDVDGNTLSYLWSLTTKPAGSTAVLSSTTLVNPVFTVDLPGTYVAQLIVNDGTVNSAADTVSITTNAVPAPTANAGPAQTVRHGSLVQLAGSGTDPQSRPLTFAWSFTSRPAGSTAALSSATIANPTFTADRPGDYILQLIVNNGFVSSPASTVTITTTNSTPVANAGANQTATLNTVVTLNGTASSDADGDALTYAWSFTSQPAGSTAVLQAPTSSMPTFTPLVAGSYVIQLIVSDAFASSAPVTVTVTTAAPGQIIIPASTTLQLGQSAAFPVTLSTGTPAGVTVTLVIADPTKASLTTLTVPFAANATTPASQPQLSGIGLGSTTITASAPFYTGATGSAQVSATMSFSAATPIIGTATQNLTLTLSAAAPTGGATINLSSSNTGAATVPATVTFTAGATTVTVPVTGVAAGATTITASAANIATATVNITVVNTLTITTASLPNGQVNASYSQQFSATGGVQPYVWSITSGTLPAGMTFTAGGLLSSTPTATASATPLTFSVTDAGPPAQTKTVNLTLTINPAVPANIVATSGGSQSAFTGAAFGAPLVATVTDAGGSPVGGVVVTFTPPASGASGTFAGGVNTATTDGAGVATSAVFTANNTVGGPYAVNATVSGVASPAVFNLTNTQRPVANLALTSGGGQSVQISTQFPQPLVVTATDSNGQPVPNATVTFAVPGSGASAAFTGGSTAVTNASGVATSNVLSANATAGTYQVTASVGAVTLNISLTNLAGPAANIAATSGGGQSAFTGAAFGAPLVATVTDSGGNPVAGATVTFAPPASGASGTFAGGVTTATTNSSGVATSATFTANGTVGGPYTVNATVSGVGSPATFSLTNTQRVVATLMATSGGGQVIPIGTAFPLPLVVTATDSGGVPVSGATVTFVVPGSGASATFAGGITAVTNASGVATSSVISANGVVGSYMASASVPGVTAVTFNLTNTSGSAAAIAVSSGSGQNAQIGAAFASPLVALVTDSGGNPVSGATVTFTAPASGASGSFAGGVTTATTNGAGQATSATFTANGTAGGPYNVNATVAGVGAPAAFALTNINPGGPFLTLSNVTVGNGLQKLATVTLSQVAPAGGLNVNITTANPALARPSRQLEVGLNQITITVAEGTTTAGVFIQGFAAAGSVQLTASASGYASGTGTATLAPSGFIIYGPDGLGVPGFSVPVGSTATVKAYPALLNSGFSFVETQQLRGGTTATVSLSATPGSVGTMAGAGQVVINGGDPFDAVSTGINFNALATGSASITASAPSGFSTVVGNSLTATVTAAGLSLSNFTVGQNLQVPTNVTLNSPAPGNIIVTVTSSNPGQVLLSDTPTGVGLASINLLVETGRNSSPEFYIQGLTSAGSVSYTASTPGYVGANGTVTLATSGFIIQGIGIVNNTFSITSLAENLQLDVVPARLDGAGAPVSPQAVRGGLTVTVPITSSSPSIGAITASPLTFTGGVILQSTAFDPITTGTTDITAGVPSGFSNPTSGDVVAATITTPAMGVTSGVSVGRNLQISGNVSLGALQSVPVTVTLTSNSGSLLLSTTTTGAGQSSITVTIPAGELNGTYNIYVTASSGTATYTATAAGFQNRTGTITMVPSGVTIEGQLGLGFGGVIAKLTPGSFFGPQPVIVKIHALDPSTSAVIEAQKLAGGLAPLSIDLVSGSPAIGTITSPVIINPGSDNTTATWTPVAVGLTTVSVTTPAGYTAPSNVGYTNISARTNP